MDEHEVVVCLRSDAVLHLTPFGTPVTARLAA
jgi:hypothetical protein